MRIGEVMGRVVLSRADAALKGGRLLVLRAFDLKTLTTGGPACGEVVVAYEELGASDGMRVGFSEGREAAMPFHPKPVALDAYVGCILDEVVIEAPGPDVAKTK